MCKPPALCIQIGLTSYGQKKYARAQIIARRGGLYLRWWSTNGVQHMRLAHFIVAVLRRS